MLVVGGDIVECPKVNQVLFRLHGEGFQEGRTIQGQIHDTTLAVTAVYFAKEVFVVISCRRLWFKGYSAELGEFGTTSLEHQDEGFPKTSGLLTGGDNCLHTVSLVIYSGRSVSCKMVVVVDVVVVVVVCEVGGEVRHCGMMRRLLSLIRRVATSELLRRFQFINSNF